MKRFTLLALALGVGLSAFAQAGVVKEAERALSAKRSFNDVQNIIKRTY